MRFKVQETRLSIQIKGQAIVRFLNLQLNKKRISNMKGNLQSKEEAKEFLQMKLTKISRSMTIFIVNYR